MKLMLVNHYDVLALPNPTVTRHSPTQDTIKLAYRRTLLQHHPDKSHPHCPKSPKPAYTIDEITTAYKILSDPLTRSDFDRRLRLQCPSQDTTAQPLSGLETVDLDDMEYDSGTGVWYRSCRCGNERGYLISERDLEREAEHREVAVGCGGCSLWVRVGFQVVDDG
jgi:diphthamide biosynthesis protein 4